MSNGIKYFEKNNKVKNIKTKNITDYFVSKNNEYKLHIEMRLTIF